MKSALFFILYIFNIYCAERINPESVLVVINEPIVVQPHLHRQETDTPDQKCCNSNTKVKLALIGLGVSVVGAVTTLIIHFTQCEDKK